jgi:hypothetical protein
MGDKIIITEDEPKPDTVIVVPKEREPAKSEKEVTVTEKTIVTKRVED